jgi:hypothetical protein
MGVLTPRQVKGQWRDAISVMHESLRFMSNRTEQGAPVVSEVRAISVNADLGEHSPRQGVLERRFVPSAALW